VQVAERLAVERGVMCLPGPAFGPGQDGHLRLAFAGADAGRIALLEERLAGMEMEGERSVHVLDRMVEPGRPNSVRIA